MYYHWHYLLQWELPLVKLSKKSTVLYFRINTPRMPVLGLDTASAKYNMPVQKFKKLDSLAPMPGTEKIPKGKKSQRDSLRFKLLEDSLKVKDFKFKIDSLYPKK